MKVVCCIETEQGMIVFRYRHGDRSPVPAIILLCLTELNIYCSLITEIRFILLCTEVWIGIRDLLHSHIQSIQNLLVTHMGHYIIGLRIKGCDDTEIHGILKPVSKEQVYLSVFQVGVELPVFRELLITVGTDLTVQIVHGQVFLKPADVLLCPLINADGFAVQAPQIMAVDTAVIFPGHEH